MDDLKTNGYKWRWKFVSALCVIGMLALIFILEEAKNFAPRKQIAFIDPEPKRRQCPRAKSSTTNHSISKVVLAVNFNNPFYQNIPLLEEFYRPLFKTVLYCGPSLQKGVEVILVKHPEGQNGYYGYQCLAEVIKLYPNEFAYLYINDDMIVNWWNFMNLDFHKIWIGKSIIVKEGVKMRTNPPTTWHWWRTADALRRCVFAVDKVKKIFGDKFYGKLLMNTKGEQLCIKGWSDFLYIPGSKSKQFKELSDIFYSKLVFLEVSVPMIVLMLEDLKNLVNVDGVYLPDLYGDIDFSSGLHFFSSYDTKMTFCHPFKLGGADLNKKIFKNIIVPLSQGFAHSFQIDTRTDS